MNYVAYSISVVGDLKMESMVCFSCGLPLSNKWDAFAYMRARLAQATKTKTAADMTVIDPDFHLALEPIFKILCIEKYCCRGFLMTSKQLDEIGS